LQRDGFYVFESFDFKIMKEISYKILYISLYDLTKEIFQGIILENLTAKVNF